MTDLDLAILEAHDAERPKSVPSTQREGESRSWSRGGNVD